MEDSFAKYTAECIARQKAFRNKYELKEYLCWLDDFMTREGADGFSDEDAFYWSNTAPEDKEMAKDLYWLAERVKSISEVNGVKCEHNDEEEFWRFSYSGVMYELGVIYGQGSYTYICKTNDDRPVLDLEPYAEKLLSEQTAVWTRDWFQSNGRKTAVLGISGGKDSAVVAGICKKALGADHVYGILMPNGEQPDISDSLDVVGCLGIKSGRCNIEHAYEAICKCVEEATGIPISNNAAINVSPRIRMAVLYAIAQTLSDVQLAKACVVGTGNRGEAEVGYTTKWGDSACDVNPIRDLWVDEVVQVGEDLGVPADIVHKPPSDGLCGKSDEENLGFDYNQVRALFMEESSIPSDAEAAIMGRHNASAHKRDPIPYFHHC